MLPLLAAAIISTTMSNSSTGGNVVSTGGNVVTDSSYSSVSVETYSNDEGATSTVQIETNDNGQVNKQTITKTAPPGGSIDIDVATSTHSTSSGQAGSAGSGQAGTVRAAVHIGSSATSAPLFGTSTPPLFFPERHGFAAYFNDLFHNLFSLFGF